jgi:hypothetical protein
MVDVVVLVGSQTFTEQGFRFRIIRVGFSEDVPFLKMLVFCSLRFSD